jgi:hypothetical protein
MWKTFTVALVLLVTVVGLQVVLPICSLSILSYHRTSRLQHIASGVPNGTPTVDIVTNEREIQWSVDERECTWKGHTYDVIRIARSNGVIHIVAISDEEEDRFKHSVTAAHTRESRSLRTINNLLAAFLLCPIHADSRDLDTVIHSGTVKTRIRMRGVGKAARGHGDVPTPPPWTWSTI